MNTPQTIQDILVGPKTGAAVTSGWLVLLINDFLGWIPDHISVIASIFGVILTMVLIYVNLKRLRLDSVRAELDLKIKTEELNRLRRERDAADTLPDGN